MGHLCPVWMETEQSSAGHRSDCKGGAKKTMGWGPVVFFAEFISPLQADMWEVKEKGPRRGYPSRAFETIGNIVFNKKTTPAIKLAGVAIGTLADNFIYNSRNS